MPNQNFPHEKAELSNRLEHQAGRVNFLDSKLIHLQSDSFIAPNVEIEFIDKGFIELIQQIRRESNESAERHLSAQLKDEQEILRNLSKEYIKD